jgi:DNA-binding NarL/FixJ family response regulator
MTCLSPRETQVLTKLAEGRTTKEIALILSIRVVTVRCYVGRARCKLGTRSTIVAILRAVQAGAIEVTT